MPVMFKLMKLQLLLFFALATPIALFFIIILYAGISTEDMKKAISESGAYPQLAEHLTKQEANTLIIYNNSTVFVSKLLTPAYFKTKTESAIDDSADWITGKTQTPPEVSFRELKQEIQLEYPDLLSNIEHVPSKSELQNSNLNVQDQALYLEQAKQMAAFVNADFTFSLGNKLEGIKLTYRILQIVLPVIIVLLICSIFFMTKLANSPPLKYKWIGATLMTSSIAGYGCIIFHPYITAAIAGTQVIQESTLFSLFLPIFIAIINHYVEIYVGYQEIVSTVFLVCAAGCILGAILTRTQTVSTIKPIYEKVTYWETPLKVMQTSHSAESKETK